MTHFRRKSESKSEINSDLNGNWRSAQKCPEVNLYSPEVTKSAPEVSPVPEVKPKTGNGKGESGLEMFFTNLAQGQPHIRVKPVRSPL